MIKLPIKVAIGKNFLNVIKDNYKKILNIICNGDTLESFSLSSGKRKMINMNPAFPGSLNYFTFILLDNIDSKLLYISVYMIRGSSLLFKL